MTKDDIELTCRENRFDAYFPTFFTTILRGSRLWHLDDELVLRGKKIGPHTPLML